MVDLNDNLTKIVSRMGGEAAAMDDAAEETLRAVRAEAAAHRRTGQYLDGLKIMTWRTKQGVLDRFVVSTDPASLSIEYGHMARDKKTHVPGLHIMANSLRRIRGIR